MNIKEIKELDFSNMLFRCSGVSKLMTSPAATKLPVGAMSYIEEQVDSIIFSYSLQIESKYLDKGNIVELENIQLHNALYFTNYVKAEEPRQNAFLKTESCDVLPEDSDLIADAKSSWSKKTFPKTKKQARKSAEKAGYHIQMQCYMSLFNRKKAEVFYSLIDTPEELCTWEDPSHHFMHDVPDELRLTKIEFEHDSLLEAQIYQRIVLARKYAVEYHQEIMKDHGIN